MRVDPDSVYLRLEPCVHLISPGARDTHSVPGVELHWKDGNRWERRTIVASDTAPTLGAILRELGELVDTSGNLEAMLDTVRR